MFYAKTWKQHKCLLIEYELNTLIYLDAMAYFAVIKTKELGLHG